MYLGRDGGKGGWINFKLRLRYTYMFQQFPIAHVFYICCPEIDLIE